MENDLKYGMTVLYQVFGHHAGRIDDMTDTEAVAGRMKQAFHHACFVLASGISPITDHIFSEPDVFTNAIDKAIRSAPAKKLTRGAIETLAYFAVYDLLPQQPQAA